MNNSSSYILGISAFYHDSAACLIHDGEIVAAAQEERFTRVKHDPSFPGNAIKYCLDQAQIDLTDINTVAFYEKPLLKFERVLENFLAIAPRGLKGFVKYMPAWLKEKVFFRKHLDDSLKELDYGTISHLQIKFCEHHLSHAAWAYFTSPFKESAILTIDGVGEWTTTAIYKGTGNDIEVLQEQSYPHSLGLLYSAFTQFLGFKVNDGEYKMMGLAPYGNRKSLIYSRALKCINEQLVTLHADGSIRLKLGYFKFLEGGRMIDERKWEALFSMQKRDGNEDLKQDHCDFALAVQDYTEEVVLLLAKEAKRITGAKNLCIAGGVGYNCAANGKLVESKEFDKIHIPPAVGDAGSAVGAALMVHSLTSENYIKNSLDLKNEISFLGPEFTDEQVKIYLKSKGQVFEAYDNFGLVCEKTSQLIQDGLVVGWMQGRMEFGARALGARSILGDPRNPRMQQIINQKIKFRESFRPFAVMLLEENSEEYFSLKSPSPYMAIISEILPAFKKEAPEDYDKLSIKQKCEWLNSDFPGITHVDYSTRVQTVDKTSNDKLYRLLQQYKKLTGHSLLINTSFNVKDEPIVCSTEDAYACFMDTNMDVLVMGNVLISKSMVNE